MPITAFEKLSGDPRCNKGHIESNGARVKDSRGQDVVVEYSQYRELVANPGKAEAFVKGCGSSKIISLPPASAEGEGGTAEDKPPVLTPEQKKAAAAAKRAANAAAKKAAGAGK